MAPLSPIDFGLGRPTTIGLRPTRPDYSYMLANASLDPSSYLRRLAVIASRSEGPTAAAQQKAAAKKEALAQQAMLKAYQASLKKQQDAINKELNKSTKTPKPQTKKMPKPGKKNPNIKLPNVPLPGKGENIMYDGDPRPNPVLPQLEDILKGKKKKKKKRPKAPGGGGFPI